MNGCMDQFDTLARAHMEIERQRRAIRACNREHMASADEVVALKVRVAEAGARVDTVEEGAYHAAMVHKEAVDDMCHKLAVMTAERDSALETVRMLARGETLDDGRTAYNISPKVRGDLDIRIVEG